MSWLPEPLRIANYRAFWSARLLATLAQLAMVTAIEYQVYTIARETMSIEAAALRLGFIGFIQFVPLFFLTPFSGWAADTMDRRTIAKIAITIEIFSALALGIATATGEISLPIIYIVAIFVGIARVLTGPSMGALASNIVPRELLPSAIALSSIAWKGATIIGPAVGGYLLAVSIETAYFFSVALFVGALIALFLISAINQEKSDRTNGPIAQVIAGIKYVRENRLVLGAISLDLFAVLLGSAVALLPIFATDIFGGGPDLFGHLRAAPAVGATAAALYFAIRPLKTEVGLKMLLAVGVFGLATIGFAFSRSIELTFLLLVIIGASDMLSVYVRSSLIQLYTPDQMRGRVGAVSTLSISASNELGDAESGLMASLFGPTMAAFIGGMGAVVVVFAWAIIFPELRKARDFNPPEPTASP
ncbi:MFS transporter [Sphingomicrobium sediminis]|uniref:MFS transporter n=1 Tax=Sphingomicrobium sediminis TaxID=2950949 RepID=A0A9X2EJ92_9SPHN|nr:MFS transporter [Sphingomicrobium sediminis]MCM8556364.1 MFS transporter [Sphingomicrobium sediminis]